MKIAIRVDASIRIGIGHVMRCLTLADELRVQGAKCNFICRELPGHQRSLIQNRGYPVFSLQACAGHEDSSRPNNECPDISWQEDVEQTIGLLRKGIGTVDWLIVDHYGLERSWEEQLRSLDARVMVIDDLADRSHECDLLLDQNFYDNLDNRYIDLIEPKCRALLGPRYALLRDEFLRNGRSLRRRDGQVRRILIFFGGTDPSNETAKALDALRLFNRPELEADIVLGGANPFRDIIQAQCNGWPNVNCHIQVGNMAELMSKADLALGAGGSATWERCFLGLPTATIIVAANQIETTEALARTGAIVNLGSATQVTAQNLVEAMEELCSKPEKLKSLSQRCRAIMGGKDFLGAAGVAKELITLTNTKGHL